MRLLRLFQWLVKELFLWIILNHSVNPKKIIIKHKEKCACNRNLNNLSSLFGHVFTVFTHNVRSSKGIEGVHENSWESSACNSTPQAFGKINRYAAILLMVQKSGVHQLRLVVYPIIFRVLYIPGGAGFLNHQQYHKRLTGLPRLLYSSTLHVVALWSCEKSEAKFSKKACKVNT